MDSGKRKSSAGIIAVLVIIVLALGGYIIYDKVLSSPKDNVVDNNKDNKDNKDNNVVEDKELALNDYTVVKLYKYINGYDRYIEEYFHSNAELTNKTVSNEMKLRTAYFANGFNNYNFSTIKESTSTSPKTTIFTISADTVLGQINEIFGSDNGYSHNNEGIGGSLGLECATLKYNQSNYELSVAPGCGDITTYALYTKLVKAVKTKDSIVLTEKSYVLYSDRVTKDLTQNSPVIASNVSNPSDEYFDKGSIVTYTFKLSHNGTYYFDNSKITY